MYLRIINVERHEWMYNRSTYIILIDTFNIFIQRVSIVWYFSVAFLSFVLESKFKNKIQLSFKAVGIT